MAIVVEKLALILSLVVGIATVIKMAEGPKETGKSQYSILAV